MKRCLGVIVARGGSKGVKNKNLRLAAGKPLIAWTIEAAVQSGNIDNLILSSDSNKIIQVANKWGCSSPFVRPSYLATDEARSIDVVLHAIKNTPRHEYIMLLQPTSPLRLSKDIDEAFELLLHNDAPSCASIVESKETPYWMYNLNSNAKLSNIISSQKAYTRRQDVPKSYLLNGAIYIAKTSWLLENKCFVSSDTIGYEMPAERSLDIDTLEDFKNACQSLSSKSTS